MNIGQKSFPGVKLSFEVDLCNRVSIKIVLTCLGRGLPQSTPLFLFSFSVLSCSLLFIFVIGGVIRGNIARPGNRG